MTEFEPDKPIYYQDTPEGKAWADWAYKMYLFEERPKWAGSMEHYDEATLEKYR